MMKSTVTAVSKEATKVTKRGFATAVMPPQRLYNRMPRQIPKFPKMPKQEPTGPPNKALWKPMPPQEPKFKAMPPQEPVNPASIKETSGGSGPMIVVALGVVGIGGAAATGMIPMPM